MTTSFEPLPATLYADAHEQGIRVDLSRADDVVLTVRDFEMKDGSKQPALALTVVAEGGYANGSVPVLDVVAFAARACPKAMARMLVEAGLAAELKRELDDAAHDLDMEEGA